MATVLIGLVVIMLLGACAGVAGLLARRQQAFSPGVHALRDDFATNPVNAPLRRGCGGMEISVRLDASGRLRVGTGPEPDAPGNAIGPVVLRELALRAAANDGSVHPGQTDSFALMIDIAETEPVRQIRAYDVLDAELRRYPGLCTRLADDEVTMGPVTVTLTGAGVPRHAIEATNDRLVFCDGNFGDVGAWGAPAMLVPIVSEHWSWRFGWDGFDPILHEERLLLQQHVRAAHDDGREVRMFGIPESSARVREAFWRVLVEAGVDVISTEKPRHLATFLKSVGQPVAAVPREATHREGSLSVASAR